MKTIAQQINWDFGANGSFLEIIDTNGKLIYSEDSSGYWNKWEYDSNGKEIYFEDSDGYWNKWKYNSNGKLIYCEDPSGFWNKRKYDSQGNEIYYKNSNGTIIDSRPKPSEDRVVEIDGVKYKLTKL